MSVPVIEESSSLKLAYQQWQTRLFRADWFARTFVVVMGRLATPIYEWAYGLMRRDLSDARTIADIGCGNGLMSNHVARTTHGKAFALLDQSAAQISAGRSLHARMRRDHEVETHVGCAESMPLPDGAYDVVYSTGSINLWTDPVAGLRECIRITRPGGRLWIFDQRPCDTPALVLDALVRHRVFGVGIPGYKLEQVRAFSEEAGLHDPEEHVDGSLYALAWSIPEAHENAETAHTG